MANQAAGTAGTEVVQPNRYNPTENSVQRTRAFTGLLVVVFGDVAIAAAAVYGVVKSGDGTNATQIVAILTSAFTAVGTMTTAYFGIRAASNTAQSAVAQSAVAQAAAETAQQAAAETTQQTAAETTQQTAAETTQQTGESTEGESTEGEGSEGEGTGQNP